MASCIGVWVATCIVTGSHPIVVRHFGCTIVGVATPHIIRDLLVVNVFPGSCREWVCHPKPIQALQELCVAFGQQVHSIMHLALEKLPLDNRKLLPKRIRSHVATGPVRLTRRRKNTAGLQMYTAPSRMGMPQAAAMSSLGP